MSTPRRRILRADRTASVAPVRHHVQLDKRCARLERERASLARWMTRLRRAFNAVEKQQRRIRYLERQLTRLEKA